MPPGIGDREADLFRRHRDVDRVGAPGHDGPRWRATPARPGRRPGRSSARRFEVAAGHLQLDDSTGRRRAPDETRDVARARQRLQTSRLTRAAQRRSDDLREARAAELLGSSEIGVGLGIDGNAAAAKSSPCSERCRRTTVSEWPTRSCSSAAMRRRSSRTACSRELVTSGLELLDEQAELPQLRGRGVVKAMPSVQNGHPQSWGLTISMSRAMRWPMAAMARRDEPPRFDERAIADRHDHEEHERFGIGPQVQSDGRQRGPDEQQRGRQRPPRRRRGSPRPTRARRNDDDDLAVAVARPRSRSLPAATATATRLRRCAHQRSSCVAHSGRVMPRAGYRAGRAVASDCGVIALLRPEVGGMWTRADYLGVCLAPIHRDDDTLRQYLLRIGSPATRGCATWHHPTRAAHRGHGRGQQPGAGLPPSTRRSWSGRAMRATFVSHHHR